MKKLFGVSLMSAMLIFGQPFMALADITGPRTINFEDIESIIAEQNINVQINQNERLKGKVSSADLKRTIKELEDDLEDINDERGEASDLSEIISLNAQKRGMLEALKQVERGIVDLPTALAIIDLQASMSDDYQTLSAESNFIKYNQSNLDLEDIARSIDSTQDQLAKMQLQESLGMVSSNNLNAFRTKLVDLQTKLESTELVQDSYERKLKDLLNEQENSLVIGSIPSVDEDFTVKDTDADMKAALESNYNIKIQEQQIVILQSALNSEKKDHGMSSQEYKEANYNLANANLKLTQAKDSLKTSYYTMIDDISKLQSALKLAEQNLEDQKVALSEAQIRMGLGMISKLEMDDANNIYQVKENAVKAMQINLFNAKCNYEWFLKGLS
ncbi:TolC family protein [Desulfosporosinus nitroreducens]|uniref:TolC family protein n=1 Tax=Desulfosporosinus nitroreducens TaxID=2018668 RepID=A0ABT8QTD7_9FIRM|nr:TolC family protein [Desulfosporosinus nitroreducens]MDO0824410.1 TolC family protein [Desulfosporosinus nitroreducens]